MSVWNSFLILCAGCGVFLMGMKLMSDGLERSAGTGMRKLFGKISNNRFAGVGVGAAVTAIIQSSSAVSVMVIGFVNAGLMTLFQATSIIMGANIGTTVTGIIVAFSAFDFALYAAALALIGVMLVMFFKKDSIKRIGSILCGLGMLFVGLNLMGDAFGTPETKVFFASVFEKLDFPLLLVLCGILFTALIQSSSAATAIVISMVGAGSMSVAQALFVVLGTNIGTCITAVLASIGATTNAKRTAFIHLMFNVIGTIIFTTVIWIFTDPIVKALSFISAPQMQIAWFHVAFNVITTMLLLPFIKQLTFIATKVISDKKKKEETAHLFYIDDRILQTPPIAVAQVVKEVLHMSEMSRANLVTGLDGMMELNIAVKSKILEEEDKIDYVDRGISRYLVKIASLPLSNEDEKLVGSLHHVISDLERIGDHAVNFIEEAEKMVEHNHVFSEEAKNELTLMYTTVLNLYDMCIKSFTERDVKLFPEIARLEQSVDNMKTEFLDHHIERLNKGICSIETGTYFNTIVINLERVADHLTNVAYSIKTHVVTRTAPKKPSMAITEPLHK